MKSVAISVTSTATLIVSADDIPREVYVHSASGSIYLGGSTVTTDTGIHLPNNTTITVFIPAKETLYAISSGTHTVKVLTPDTD
jgi:hypothetical protein